MIVSLGFGLAVAAALDLDFELAPKGVAIELVPHFDCDAVTSQFLFFSIFSFVFGYGKAAARGQDKYDFQFAAIAFTRFA